ncbi:MAG: hypothetical protein ACHQU0_01765 [Candidatus Paceibacteria bacterium]
MSTQTDTAQQGPAHYQATTFTTIILKTDKPGEAGVRRSKPTAIAQQMIAEGKATAVDD